MAQETSAFTGSITAAGGWIGRAYAAFANVLKSFKHRREVAALLKLDDAMLRDIGVTRSDIHSVLAEPLFRDASWRLSERASETRAAQRLQKQDELRWAGDGDSLADADFAIAPPRPAPMGRAA